MKLLHIWLWVVITFLQPGNFTILLLEKTKLIKNMTTPVTIINKMKILTFFVLSMTRVPYIRRRCDPLCWTFILHGNTLLFIEIHLIPIIANIKNDGRTRNNVWRMKYFHLRCDNQIICDRIKKISQECH